MSATSDQDLERWRALVERGLKGAPFDSLVAETLEGLEIQPLYTERDRPAEEGIPWAPRSPRLVGPAGVSLESLVAHRDAGATLAWTAPGNSPIPDVHGLVTIATRLRGVGGLASAGTQWVRPIADPWTGWVTMPTHRDETAHARGLDQIAAAVAAGSPSLGVAAWTWDALYDANAVDELALTLASLVESLRVLDVRGVSLEAAVEGATIGIACGVEFFDDIAKLRALRRLVDRVLVACGIRTRPFVAAVTSPQSQPVDRPVNLLRNTIAASAALLGGADGVAVFPHEVAESDPLPERISRNVPLVLSLESCLHSVDDPARGSFYVEWLTDELVRAAWESFRAIEGEGGLARSHTVVRERLEHSKTRREQLVRTRKRPLVGLSRYPTTERLRSPYSAHDSQPFVGLRYAAQGHVSRVITVGTCPPARIDFAREILAISGLPDTVHAFTDDAAAALGDASIVILAGPDAALAVEIPAVARALKSAGAKAIGVAGKPGSHEQALRDAGVDAFVFVGADVVTFGETLLERAKGAASS